MTQPYHTYEEPRHRWASGARARSLVVVKRPHNRCFQGFVRPPRYRRQARERSFRGGIWRSWSKKRNIFSFAPARTHTQAHTMIYPYTTTSEHNMLGLAFFFFFSLHFTRVCMCVGRPRRRRQELLGENFTKQLKKNYVILPRQPGIRRTTPTQEPVGVGIFISLDSLLCSYTTR